MSEINFRRTQESDLQAIIMISGFDGASFSSESKEALWAKFYTAAPRRQRQGALHGQIEADRIVADWQRDGLGGRLLAWAIAECRMRDCKVVQLTTDKSRVDAHGFYDRLGLKASHIGCNWNCD